MCFCRPLPWVVAGTDELSSPKQRIPMNLVVLLCQTLHCNKAASETHPAVNLFLARSACRKSSAKCCRTLFGIPEPLCSRSLGLGLQMEVLLSFFLLLFFCFFGGGGLGRGMRGIFLCVSEVIAHTSAPPTCCYGSIGSGTAGLEVLFFLTLNCHTLNPKPPNPIKP